jgi:AraC-like DNA-binding protein
MYPHFVRWRNSAGLPWKRSFPLLRTNNLEQRCVIKFFVKEGMRRAGIIDRLNKHYGGDALQRTQVYHWIKEEKFGNKELSNIPPPRRAPDKGLYDCIAKALQEDPHLSTARIAKALTISSTTLRNHLAKSLGEFRRVVNQRAAAVADFAICRSQRSLSRPRQKDRSQMPAKFWGAEFSFGKEQILPQAA